MKRTLPGMPDEAFIRGNAPMTKRDIRILSMTRLALTEDSLVADIGAGTGSITVEAALIAEKGRVLAVERDSECCELIHQNLKHFELDNVEVIQGYAPECLPENQKLDAVFIGGSGGQMASLFEWVSRNLKSGGRVVVNAITLENAVKAIEYVKSSEFENQDVITASISKARFIGGLSMMEAQNPITIVSAVKK